MAEQRKPFVLSDYIKGQGYSLVGGDTQNPIVQDNEGNKFTFNTVRTLAAEGFKPGQLDLRLNTPDSALQESPVSAADRAKLSFGNDKGKVGFLRKQFKEAAFNADGLTVLDKDGIWKQVDPDNYNDPWEVAKDLADWAGDVPVIGGSIGGAVAAGGSTLGFGTAAGAAGGAGAGEGARVAVGKLLGTYDGDAVDVAKDVGVEMLLSMGGSAVAAGVKPGLRAVAGSLKAVKDQAPEASKKLYRGFMSKVTGVNEKAYEVATSNLHDDVVRHFKNFSDRGLDSMQALDGFVTPIQEKGAQKFLDITTKALPKAYEASLETFYQVAEGTGFKANIRGTVLGAVDDVAKLGLGVAEKGPKNTFRFRPFTAQEIATRRAAGITTQEFSNSQLREASRMFSALQRRLGIGDLKGRQAAEELATINRFLNDQVTGAADENMQRVLTVIRDGFHKRFTKQLADHDTRLALAAAGGRGKPSLSDAWKGGYNLYEEFRGAVNGAKQLLRQDQGARAFADRLLADSAAGRGAQGRAQSLLRLAQISSEADGRMAEKIHRRLVTLETARQFSPIFPRVGFWSSGATTAGATLGFVKGGFLGAASVLGLSSPRLAFSQIQAAKKVGQLAGLGKQAVQLDGIIQQGTLVNQALKSLSPPARVQLLKDPRALQAFTFTALRAMGEDPEAEGQQMAEQALQEGPEIQAPQGGSR